MVAVGLSGPNSAKQETSCADGKVLTSPEESVAAEILRREIVAEMQRQRDFLSLFVTSDWDQYVRNMARSGTWGGAPCSCSSCVCCCRIELHAKQCSYHSYTLCRQSCRRRRCLVHVETVAVKDVSQAGSTCKVWFMVDRGVCIIGTRPALRLLMYCVNVSELRR